jgi:hypothetical protein
MSRSRKKEPGSTIACCKSQKAGKSAASKRFRRIARQMLQRGVDVLPTRSRELTNQYDLGGDGKRYWKGLEKKYLRK